jgi:hypothetical protein
MTNNCKKYVEHYLPKISLSNDRVFLPKLIKMFTWACGHCDIEYNVCPYLSNNLLER